MGTSSAMAEMIEVEGDLAPGTRVDVRIRYDGSWSRGFTVERIEPAGYVLRRVSDGSVLPVPFDPGEVHVSERECADRCLPRAADAPRFTTLISTP